MGFPESDGSDASLKMFHWNVEVDEDEFLQFKRPLPLPMLKREREEEEVAPSLESMGSDAPLPMFHWNVEFDDDEWLDFERPPPLPTWKREREEEEEVSPSVEIWQAPAPAPTPTSAPAAADPEQRVAAAQATVDRKRKLLQAMAEMPESESEKSSSLSPSYNLWDVKLAPTTTTVAITSSCHRAAMPLLPRINSDAARPESKRATLKAFLRKWLKVNYQDLLCMAFVGALAYGIYHSPVIITRTFPVTFDRASGDIVYPQWAYPDRGWILPAWLSGLISIALPIITYIVAQIQIKSVWDASNAIIGTVWSVTLASLFQVTLKQLVGGFRPYFLDVCMPDISLAKSHNKTGLNGVGFYQIMYTTEICTQPDQSRIQNAITSFPSGHTTAAFAGFGFLFLWLNAKLKVWADHKPAFWKLSLTFVPMLAAVLIAGSLTIDAAHNWYDILGGGFIGTIMAFASYRSTYASVWDWRFNHLPLQETESFRYGFDGDLDYAAQTISMAAGWGGRKVRLPESSSAPAISTESTLRSGAEEIENLDANTRRKRRGPVGEEAV